MARERTANGTASNTPQAAVARRRTLRRGCSSLRWQCMPSRLRRVAIACARVCTLRVSRGRLARIGRSDSVRCNLYSCSCHCTQSSGLGPFSRERRARDPRLCPLSLASPCSRSRAGRDTKDTGRIASSGAVPASCHQAKELLADVCSDIDIHERTTTRRSRAKFQHIST